jgi:hypothetical protein
MKFKKMLIVPVAAVLIAAGAKVGTALAAQDTSTQAADQVKKPNAKKVAEGEVEARRLLLLMDRDASGKVSHEEFMNFMEAEFVRLDVNKDGELDVKELTQARFTPHVGTHR